MIQRVPYQSQILRKEQVKELMTNNIPEFVTNCLRSNSKYIVPIGSEGLSLLIPQLIQRYDLIGRVVPSKRFLQLPSEEWAGSQVHLVDASVFTGSTMKEFYNELKKKQDEDDRTKYFFSALLVKEDVRGKFKWADPQPMFFNKQDYEWARESISDYLLDNVITRVDDLPMWEITIPSTNWYNFLKSLTQIPGIYQSNYNPAPWRRYSYCDLRINDDTWLPKSTFIDILKVRVFLNRKTHNVRILPLFIPKIQDYRKVSIIKFINLLQDKYDAKDTLIALKHLVEDRKDELPTNEIHQWVSILGSILLLSDFISHIIAIGLINDVDWRDIRLTDQTKALLLLERRSRFANLIESFTKQICAPREYRQGEQTELIIPKFIFCEVDTELKYKPDYLNPERILLAELSQMEEIQTHENVDHRNIHWTMDMIYDKAHFLSRALISRAMDVIIDEGILKPVSWFTGALLQRAFRPGGEDEIQRLKIAGETFECMKKSSNVVDL